MVSERRNKIESIEDYSNVNESVQNSDSSSETFKKTPVFQTIHKVINDLLNNFVYRPNYHFRTAINFWENKSY